MFRDLLMTHTTLHSKPSSMQNLQMKGGRDVCAHVCDDRPGVLRIKCTSMLA
jgi:hypothetical protein